MAQCDNNTVPQPELQSFGAALRQFFRRRVRSESEVEDLVQEVFLRLMSRKSLGPIGNLGGYVFLAAANLFRERRRQAARHDVAVSPFIAAGLLEGTEDFSTERIHEGRQACGQVELGLRELPDRVRSVFILNRFEDMPAREIARRLGVSLSTVEKDMARAIQHLKERLK